MSPACACLGSTVVAACMHVNRNSEYCAVLLALGPLLGTAPVWYTWGQLLVLSRLTHYIALLGIQE